MSLDSEAPAAHQIPAASRIKNIWPLNYIGGLRRPQEEENPGNPELQAPLSIPTSADQQARNRETFASFGEDGTTATANAYGHLLQITRYFGNNPSGFFSVDLPSIAPPWFVDSRMEQLRECCKDPESGMRIRLEERETDGSWKFARKAPTMEFVNARWPQFTTTTKQFDVTINYVVLEGTVYQNYLFQLRDTSNYPELPTLIVSADLLIRDLDFSINSEQNNRELNDTCYSNCVPSPRTCLVRTHKSARTKEDSGNDIALVISPFIGGRAQKFDGITGSSDYKILPDERARSDFVNEGRGKFEVTLAYTLELIDSKDVGHRQPPVSDKTLVTAKEKLTRGPSKTFRFAEDEHLDFIVKRNLEHILSVCSIPVGNVSTPVGNVSTPVGNVSTSVSNVSTPVDNVSTSVSNVSTPVDNVSRDKNTTTIALTCGDISGHRVATEASFHAFQFLLLALKHLPNRPSHDCQDEECKCNIFVCQLRSRIWRVCRGHLRWLLHIAKRPEQQFSPHYWATGEKIVDIRWLPGKTLVDTPLQIIKFGDFYAATENKEVLENAGTGLQDCIETWIRKDLDCTNRNGKYAFPRSSEGEIRTYYFIDHMVIWQAVKSLEKLGFESHLQLKIEPPPEEGPKYRSYSSAEIQKNILKRFTTENPVSKKRMIAVSRSSSETRFLFHPKDTMLFYGMEMGLFDKPATTEDEKDLWQNKIDVWKNTVDCQMHHEDNNEAPWYDPLRYTLSLMMATKKKRMTIKPAPETHRLAKAVLLQGSSQNGLFEGRLDENKEPIKFEDEFLRDSWWSATFEIPFAVWKYRLPGGVLSAPGDGAIPPSEPPLSQFLEVFTRLPSTSEETTNRETSAMKRSVPFNNVIDQKNIAELSDEWLYNEPRFFDQDGDDERMISDSVITEFCTINAHTSIGRIIDSAVETANSRIKQSSNIGLLSDTIALVGFIADVRRTKRFKKNAPYSADYVCNEQIRQKLQKKRTPVTAKKRFLWLFRADRWTTLICYLASSEKDELSLFFDKHAAYDKYFFEDTTAVLNKWITELHLSFYQILENDPKGLGGIPNAEGIRFPDSGEGTHTKWIGRAAMSFRFDGDYFDRYWTCHFLEYNPQHLSKIKPGGPEEPTFEEISQTDRTKSGSSGSKEPWRQRRVLELLLFDRILQKMITCTAGILEETKDRVREVYVRPTVSESHRKISSEVRATALLDALELFSELNNDLFLSTSGQWQRFQQVLQVIEEDLDENLAQIKLWQGREKEREPERPRWTRNDERRYRSTISKLLVQNNHKIQQLERYHASIISFNSSLTRRLEIMRSDLELRGADDIRLFTYVTVVFLPVGFATGIFSMSDAPTSATLVSMIVTAAAALAATLVALINAKLLEATLVGPIIRLLSFLAHLIADPLVYTLVRFLALPIRVFLQHGDGNERSASEKPVYGFLNLIGRFFPIEKARNDYYKAREERKQAGQSRKGEKGGKNHPTQPSEEKQTDGRAWWRESFRMKRRKNSDDIEAPNQPRSKPPERRRTSA